MGLELLNELTPLTRLASFLGKKPGSQSMWVGGSFGMVFGPAQHTCLVQYLERFATVG